jgi:hypothetical protein
LLKTLRGKGKEMKEGFLLGITTADEFVSLCNPVKQGSDE